MKTLAIQFPSHNTLTNALKAEYPIAENSIKAVEGYLLSVEFSETNAQIINGFVIYEYYESDVDEYIYMTVGFSMVDNTFTFNDEFEEPGGHDMIEWAENWLLKNHNAIKISD